MKGFEKASRVLEFDKVLALLGECATNDGVRELIAAIEPADTWQRINILQQETEDAVRLSVNRGDLGLSGISDIRPAAQRAAKGASLSARELLEVAAVLNCAARAETYCGAEDKGSLADYFDTIVPNRFLERKIKDAIISPELISDSASDTLYSIRRDIRRTESNVRDLLSKYTGGAQNKYLQENIVTVRNGRFVIPVKAEYRNEVKGLIHDTSASGATLFIEPLAVLEANNRLRELRSHEAEEIERILEQLSQEVGRFSEILISDYDTLTRLGVIFAKAQLSLRFDCRRPRLTESRGALKISSARHPLIPAARVVPVTIEADEGISAIVITGPNTGGKTVTLKTIGLFALMAQSGLQLPCAEDTVLPVFGEVLPDIGDEQSIEQSLSTFSGHIANIVEMLENVTERSLVLFDELGAGTDPVEGAALAVSILEKIQLSGAFCAATTHYAEMKEYALENDSVLNASCEFDVETLRPTYRLITGIPGRSNAFAIASRLGIPDDVIERAKSFMDEDSRRFEDVIGRLQNAETQMREESEKARAARAEAQRKIDKVRQECEELTSRAKAEAERIRNEADQVLARARASSDYVMAQLEEARRSKEKEDFARTLDQARRSIRESLGNVGKTVTVGEKDSDYTLPRELRKGDRVQINGMSKVGTVVSVSGDTASVSFGSATTKASLDSIKLVDSSEASDKKQTTSARPAHDRSLKHEIDVRGQTGDDAWFMVDRYIDSCIYEGYGTVTIVHGKGTGALRAAMWRYLKGDRRVKSFRSGTYGEGDYGVTVVELKT